MNLANQTWPVHGRLHSLVGATSVGVVAGLATHVIGKTLVNRWFPGLMERAAVRAEFGLWPALLGGVVAGFGASLLDAIMHSDVQPLWPFSTRNDFLDLIGPAPLHYGCLLAAVLGAVILYWRERFATETG